MDALEPSSEQRALHMSLQLFDPDGEVAPTDELLQRIEAAVIELLSTNPERLMQILYRIDVDESRVNDVMQHAPVASVAGRIAELIIERMRNKVRTRQLYREMSRNDSDDSE